MRLWRRRADDVDEEIATHIAMATRDRIARGESPDVARSRALREFGRNPDEAEVRPASIVENYRG